MKEAILKCANNMTEKPGELKEEEFHVEVVRRKEDDQNPRTRAWKVTVPNLWREQAQKSDFYPRGWSHRQWFERRNTRRREEHGQPGAVGPGAGGPAGERPAAGGPAARGAAARGPAAGEPGPGEPGARRRTGAGRPGAKEAAADSMAVSVTGRKSVTDSESDGDMSGA